MDRLGPGIQLAPALRSEMEARFGAAFGDVRIHDNAPAHANAAALAANAYTVGSDIVFARGRYVPTTQDGKRLLTHELAHVIQQRRGGPEPLLDTNAAYEWAADRAVEGMSRGETPIAVEGSTGIGVARDAASGPRDRYLVAFTANRAFFWNKYHNTPEDWPCDDELRELWAAIGVSSQVEKVGPLDDNAMAHKPESVAFADKVRTFQQQKMGRKGAAAHGAVDPETARRLRAATSSDYLKVNPTASPGGKDVSKPEQSTETATVIPVEIELESGSQQGMGAEFPGYSQGNADSCAAASLVTALMIWDKEHELSTGQKQLLATACDRIFTYMESNKKTLIEGWNKKGIEGDHRYNTLFEPLRWIRATAHKPETTISEVDYQRLSKILVFLFNDSSNRGLAHIQLLNLQHTLGLSTGEETKEQTQNFDDLFEDPILTALKPGEIVQISWYVQREQGLTPTPHNFLVGRFKRERGPWFLSDQAPSPPTELEAGSPFSLKLQLLAKKRDGRSSIYTGEKLKSAYEYTGVTRLRTPAGI